MCSRSLNLLHLPLLQLLIPYISQNAFQQPHEKECELVVFSCVKVEVVDKEKAEKGFLFEKQ